VRGFPAENKNSGQGAPYIPPGKTGFYGALEKSICQNVGSDTHTLFPVTGIFRPLPPMRGGMRAASPGGRKRRYVSRYGPISSIFLLYFIFLHCQGAFPVVIQQKTALVNVEKHNIFTNHFILQ
jgi:hypothetical protein